MTGALTLAGLCAAAGLLSLVVGLRIALALLVLVLLALLLLQHHQMARLSNWSREPSGTPLPRAQGAWEYVFAGLARRERDAIELREKLAASLRRFREAAQALPDGVIYLTRHRTIEWVNTAAAGYLGLDAERDVGRAITALVRDPAFVSCLRDEVRDKVVLRGGHHEGLTLEVQVIPFGDDRELVLVRDITQHERLDMMRRDFVANVSHELKTPLTVVSGFVETLIDGDEDFSRADRIHFLELALDQSQRMQRLVEDLLTLSSLQAGDPQAADEAVDVPGLLRSVLAEGEALSSGQHELQFDNRGPKILLGNPGELHSAFSNLVSNAVRYTPAGGRITLRWAPHVDGGAAFSVQDSGIGIEPQHLGRLTERFYRVDQGRSRASGGTGLGLAIVKHVLTRHNAQLGITSEPGQGSCFTAHFPSRRVRA